MNKPIFTTAFILSALILPLEAEASSFTGINIFGDSLVETGNLFNSTNLPSSPPYFEGRFANGEIWVDTLADNFDLNPVLSSDLGATIPTQGVNFAFSGSTTGSTNVGGEPLPGLQQQIESFRSLTNIQPADANALNILWAGANDYNEAFFNPDSLTVPITELPEQVTGNLSSAVESLYEVGARKFLVVNLPNLGETPFADFLDGFSPGVSSQLNTLSGSHNLLLEQKITNLNTSLPGIDLVTLDVNSLFTQVITEPDKFGFTDVDNSCLLNFQPGFRFDGVCDNPDEFLFWDNVHPTGATHQLVAQLALDTLAAQQPVPEPSNIWGLLLVLASLASFSCRYKVN